MSRLRRLLLVVKAFYIVASTFCSIIKVVLLLTMIYLRLRIALALKRRFNRARLRIELWRRGIPRDLARELVAEYDRHLVKSLRLPGIPLNWGSRRLKRR